ATVLDRPLLRRERAQGHGAGGSATRATAGAADAYARRASTATATGGSGGARRATHRGAAGPRGSAQTNRGATRSAETEARPTSQANAQAALAVRLASVGVADP